MPLEIQLLIVFVQSNLPVAISLAQWLAANRPEIFRLYTLVRLLANAGDIKVPQVRIDLQRVANLEIRELEQSEGMST